MNILKKFAYPILLMTLGALFIGGVYTSFFAPRDLDLGVSIHKTYASIQDLKNEADLIVEGTSLPNQKTFQYDQVLFTQTNFKINQIYQGTLNKNTIKILETGGFDGKHHWTIEGNRVMDQNENYILFLKKYQGPVTNEESYIVIGAYQGRFVLDGQEISPGKAVAESIAKVKDKQTLIQMITNP